MNASVFVVLLAVAGYVSADCGCLKCSKDLTVCGDSIPVSDCGPAKVIYRGGGGGAPGGCVPGQRLPVTIQAPVPVASAAEATGTAAGISKDLTYEVLPSAPVSVSNQWCGRPTYREYKIQTPVALPTGPASVVSLPAANLKSCVDRVVLPAPAVEYSTSEMLSGPYNAGGALLNEGISMYDSNRWGARRGGAWNRNIAVGPAAVVESCGTTVVERVAPTVVERVAPTIVESCASSPAIVETISAPVYRSAPAFRYRSGCGTGFDGYNGQNRGCGCDSRKFLYRYRNSIVPTTQAKLEGEKTNESNRRIVEDISNLDTALAKNKTASGGLNRKKREVPLLKHGYKFFMNMLPEFVQEPIKNTVNTFALTHPDKKLQALYNQPKQITLKEKLLLQSRRNMNLLKKKLLGRHLKKGATKNPVANALLQKEVRNFLANLKDPIEHSRPRKIHSRLPDLQETKSEHSPNRNTWLDFNTRLSKGEFLKELDMPLTDSKEQPQFTEYEKARFLEKLRTLNEDGKRRAKRSTLYRNYINKIRQDPKKHVVLGSEEFVLPFYQVKLDGSDERQYYDNNAAGREEMLRKIIRKELQKYKFEQTSDAETVGKPLDFKNVSPHSPLFHLINLPLKFIQNLNELGKEALPVVSSVPKVIKSSKKYFKDFGKNFKKNLLHFASDVIGDFDNLETDNNILETILGPSRLRRSINRSKMDGNNLEKEVQTKQYEPDYSLVFEFDAANQNDSNDLDVKIRKKRYILKMVDEDEVEQFLMEKLGDYLAQSEDSYRGTETVGSPWHYGEQDCPICQTCGRKLDFDSSEERIEKKVILEQLKPKIIIDNNGLPFLELGGYKKPMLKKPKKNKAKQRKTQDSMEYLRPYYSSGEVDSERIGHLINHAKDHVESSYNPRFSEMPVKTIKEKMSQILLETDVLVHMDFEKYDEIYDNLIALQHIKSSVEQDWKRLILSKRIDDMNAKISLLGKFKEMQHFKDITLRGTAYALNEEIDNKFMTKKLLKVLVRLQKLQCVINQVVDNVHAKLHMGSKCDMAKEIKYVDYFTGLNFVNAKTRNEMICNLRTDRDLALHQNIELLDQLKKLVISDGNYDKINEESSLLWEMRNIEKLQASTIDEMTRRLSDGYKIKKELKILFDLLRRHEVCEAEQKKLLSQTQDGSSEIELSEELSDEDSDEGVNTMRERKEVVKKKFDVEEYRAKLQERLKKRKALLRKNLRKNLRRKSKAESSESDEDE